MFQKKSDSTATSRTRKERFIKSWNQKVASLTTRRYHTSERGALMRKEEIFLSKKQKLQDTLYRLNDNDSES